MTVPTISLTGSALTGIAPHLLSTEQRAALPATVKLGRIRPPVGERCANLAHHFDESRVTTPPPASLNRRDKAAASLAHMYLNDRYGDCVVAGKAHAFGVWSANDSDGPGVVVGTDDEIYQQYQQWCGPGDNGCVIVKVLQAIQSKGMTLGGKTYKIDAFCKADWTNQLLVQVAQYLYGATCIGINLPQAWTTAAVWDVTSTPIVGGHDVTPIDYSSDGVYVASWGRVYLITWRAFTSRKWLEEFYVMLSSTWYGGDALASACGVNAATLQADLNLINSGTVPPIPDPNPPPPPPPPVGSGIVRVDTQAKVVTVDPDWKVVVRS